jgi:hypothetical protein
VGRLDISPKGASWRPAQRGEDARDRRGAEAVHAIFAELAAARRPAAKKKAVAKKKTRS